MDEWGEEKISKQKEVKSNVTYVGDNRGCN